LKKEVRLFAFFVRGDYIWGKMSLEAETNNNLTSFYKVNGRIRALVYEAEFITGHMMQRNGLVVKWPADSGISVVPGAMALYKYLGLQYEPPEPDKADKIFVTQGGMQIDFERRGRSVDDFAQEVAQYSGYKYGSLDEEVITPYCVVRMEYGSGLHKAGVTMQYNVFDQVMDQLYPITCGIELKSDAGDNEVQGLRNVVEKSAKKLPSLTRITGGPLIVLPMAPP
jgi:hypothetical protein